MSVSLCVCRWPHGLQIATYVRSKLDDFVGSCQAAVSLGRLECADQYRWACGVARPSSRPVPLTTDNGQRTTDNGQRTTDNGQRSATTAEGSVI
jgi:hypothetical protein